MTETSMPQTRVVLDGSVMGGLPCLRGTRVPVVTILASLAEHLDPRTVLADFPQLAREDLSATLSYAAAASGPGNRHCPEVEPDAGGPAAGHPGRAGPHHRPHGPGRCCPGVPVQGDS